MFFIILSLCWPPSSENNKCSLLIVYSTNGMVFLVDHVAKHILTNQIVSTYNYIESSS